MTTRRLSFTGSAGHPLSGRLEVPEGPVKAWAVFAHCFTCTKDSVAAVRVARALMGRGIGVLRFDFMGLGESGGAFADTSFTNDMGDLIAAVEAMTAQRMAPSLMIGHSMGGAATLAAARRLPGIRAFATIGAPFDVGHVTRQVGEAGVAAISAEGEAEVRLAGRPFRLKRAFLDDLRDQDQGARIAGLHRPLLILHAPTDDTVGIDEAGKIFMAARHPKSFISLDGADHLLTRARDADYVAEVIAAWASRYLVPEADVRAAGQEGDVVAEETGAGKFQVQIRAGGVRFLSDEPEDVGGLGSGPTPYDLLSAALAACTTMTLRLYAEHKGLAVERIRTAVGHVKRKDAQPRDLFSRRIAIEGDLDAAQRARLLEMADRCPVHRTLAGGAAVETVAGDPPAPGEGPEKHALDMQSTVDAP